MFIRALIGGAIVALFFASAAHAAQSTGPAETIERGRDHTAMFYAGETAALWERFGPELRATIGDEAGLRAFRADLETELGAEAQLLDEHASRLLRYAVYTRTVRFEKADEPFQVQWGFDDDGTVAGFSILPAPVAAPSRFLAYQTRTVLRLPFAGAWHVLWGGASTAGDFRTVLENYHAVAADQRFAYDFLVERAGRTHDGDGTANEQYYCFGRPVLAPGDGVVVAAQNGIADNAPTVMNPDQPLGNYVIIDHENGEYSFLTHLQAGSVEVATGDRIRAGTLLGRCGNSGNSSEPHLHYHLQTTATPFRGEGLPTQFQSYRADGLPIARGEPRQGQTVEPD